MNPPGGTTAGGERPGDQPAGAERLRRWRLVLGSAAADEFGAGLGKQDAAMDAALAALYDADARNRGDRPGGGPPTAGLGASSPGVARWLGDIRAYFPSTVVQVMQRDAIERLNLTRLLLEPELLEAIERDIQMVGTLLSLGRVMPESTKVTARLLVRRVVDEIERRVAERTRATVAGAFDRSLRTNRPPLRAVDWNRTIQANLARYPADHRTVVPERLIGHAQRRRAVARDVVAIDQSGSMAESVVYASVFGSVLASMRSLRTSLVAFDTAIVDLTEQLHDPVEVLFGVQLGAGPTSIVRSPTASR